MKPAVTTTILLTALAALSASAQPTIWLGETPTITGRVQNASGPADIGIVMGSGEYVVFERGERVERIGQMAADGTFTMTLPTPSRPAPPAPCPGKQVSNPSAKVSVSVTFPLMAASSVPTPTNTPARSHFLIYSDADTTITGSCRFGDVVQTYSMILLRGWNWISLAHSANQPVPTRISNTTSAIEWFAWRPR